MAKKRRAMSVGGGARAKRREVDVPTIAEMRDLTTIKPRVGTPTRGLDPVHVVKLAASIHALGLIEPIAIDADGHLLAGAHRLAACQVLAATERGVAMLDAVRDLSPGAPAIDAAKSWTGPLGELEKGTGELNPLLIPVRIFALRSGDQEERALAIEAAENEQRQDYKPAEVRALYERLKASGFRVKRGRPKRGEKSAVPVIAAVINKSERYVRSLVRPAQPIGSTSNLSEEYDGKRARQALMRYRTRHDKGSPDKTTDATEPVAQSPAST